MNFKPYWNGGIWIDSKGKQFFYETLFTFYFLMKCLSSNWFQLKQFLRWNKMMIEIRCLNGNHCGIMMFNKNLNKHVFKCRHCFKELEDKNETTKMLQV